MRILICDDHRLFVEALAVSLTNRGQTVVATATCPDEAARLVTENDVDVCLMDAHFPGGDCFAAIRRLIDNDASTRVVILSADCHRDIISAGLAAGATGFVLKRASVDVILEVLDDVHAGELVVRVEAWTDHQAAAGGSTRPEMLAEPLTLREQEVLTKLVGGAGTEVIAREMGIQYSTARTHIQNVLGKLGVHSKVAAVAFAVGSGLVTLAPAEHEAAVRPPLRPPSPQPLRRPPGYFVPRTAWAAAGGG